MTFFADIIIENGAVLTMDAARPQAQAVAIGGNRIIRVGSVADCAALRGPDTRIIDAAGATVLPGFNEAHLHIFGGGVSLSQMSVAGVKGIEPLRARLAAYREANPQAAFIVAGSANYDLITGERSPLVGDLDEVCPDVPLLVYAADHHTAWANSAALKAAGIENGADVGPGSEVVVDGNGRATGELREAPAINLVNSLSSSGGRDVLGAITTAEECGITAEQRAQDMEKIREALQYCVQFGITSIQNMDGNYYQLDMLRELASRGDLPIRVRMPYLHSPGKDVTELRKAAAWRQEFESSFLTSDFVKIFADGVVESGTAYLVGSYADAPGENGPPLFSDTDMTDAIVLADSLGLQVAVHAIGDGAVRQVLNAYEAAKAHSGRSDARHRIEHVELLTDEDFPRFAELGVVASMQSAHPPGAMDFPAETYLPRIGPEREHTAFRTRELLDSGTALVFSSDWPVARLAPLDSIAAAVNRKPCGTRGRDQSVTLMQALSAYTAAGAWVEFKENQKGRLAPGFLADIVILKADITALPTEELPHAGIRMTLCDGKVIYG